MAKITLLKSKFCLLPVVAVCSCCLNCFMPRLLLAMHVNDLLKLVIMKVEIAITFVRLLYWYCLHNDELLYRASKFESQILVQFPQFRLFS